ncbi:MAG: P83/100 family protein, partial [Termitinemataceae bacterium]
STRNSRIIFINYEGPHSRIETKEDIWGIGYALGRAIKAGAVRAGASNRYFAVHSVSDINEQLNADIFGLGIDVGVDHIKNLRLILQGYLQGAYEYQAADAALLAEFITIYNAVYRGNWNYFTSRYTSKVVNELEKDKAGLSIRFDEWPGKALIVIPLATAKAGSLSAVDTSPITEKPVIEQMRTEADRGVESRKDMVDLKEREAAEAQQTAKIQKEAITQEEARIAQERAALEEQKKQLEAERARAAQQTTVQPEQTVAGEKRTTGAGPQQDEQPVKTEQQLAQEEAAIQAKEAALAKQEQALEQQKQEAETAERRAQQKEAEAKAERAEIAKDQQTIIQSEEAAKTAPSGVLGIKLLQSINALGKLVLVNPADGKELTSSTLNTINSRTLIILPEVIIAIAGMSQGSGAIRLVQINPKSLEMLQQGNDDISPHSLIWTQGQDLYAIIIKNGNNYLGRFSQDLKLQSNSSIEVHPFASVLFYNDVLLTQRLDGSVVILNPKDLTEKK